MSLERILREAADGLDGVLGVSVKHHESGVAASINGAELFPTASVFKLPVIVEFYRQVEAGGLGLDDRFVLRERDKVPGSGILKELSEGLELLHRSRARGRNAAVYQVEAENAAQPAPGGARGGVRPSHEVQLPARSS